MQVCASVHISVHVHVCLSDVHIPVDAISPRQMWHKLKKSLGTCIIPLWESLGIMLLS